MYQALNLDRVVCRLCLLCKNSTRQTLNIGRLRSYLRNKLNRLKVFHCAKRQVRSAEERFSLARNAVSNGGRGQAGVSDVANIKASCLANNVYLKRNRK